MSNTILEYVWLGANNELRSKTKVVSGEVSLVAEMPLWSFDGSSTEQAPGNHSDCILKPVKAYPNPFHVMTVNDYYLVMCEVVDDIHNKRALITSDSQTYWFGFEQEYFIYRHGRPLGWPASSDAMPQGNELSNEIRSTADKERVIILAEAYKTSEEIRGEGDATAAAIYAESFSRDPEFYEFTRSMKAYDATFNNKSDVLVIDPRSDFFKYLNKSKGNN